MNSNEFPVIGAEQSGVNSANALIYSSFVLAGVVTTLLGPMLPLLMARWSMTDERAGLFFTFQFFGNLAGIATLGPLLSRRGYGQTFVIGFAFIALGVAGLNSGNEFVVSLFHGCFWIRTGIDTFRREFVGGRNCGLEENIRAEYFECGVGHRGDFVSGAGAVRSESPQAVPFCFWNCRTFIGCCAAIALMNIEPRARESGGARMHDGRLAVSKMTHSLWAASFFCTSARKVV